jgi:hypothetical protein
VWLSPQTIVIPGSVKPCSGPVELVKILDAESGGVLGERLHLQPALRLLDAERAVGRRHVVVDDREGALRGVDLAARYAQPLEGLRARHLVDEVAVDVEEGRAVVRHLDDVVVPDLVVERPRRAAAHVTPPSLAPEMPRGRAVCKRGGQCAATGLRETAA